MPVRTSSPLSSRPASTTSSRNVSPLSTRPSTSTPNRSGSPRSTAPHIKSRSAAPPSGSWVEEQQQQPGPPQQPIVVHGSTTSRVVPSKPRMVTLHKNGTRVHPSTGVRVCLPVNMQTLLDLATQKLKLLSCARACYFASDYSLCARIEDIEDKTDLIITCGEPVKSSAPVKRTSKSAAKPVTATVPASRSQPTTGRQNSRPQKVMSASSGGPFGGAPSAAAALPAEIMSMRLAYDPPKRLRTRNLELIPEKRFEDVKWSVGLGTLSLRHQALTSFEGLGSVSDLTEIYLQNNLFSSFEHFELQPRLKELHMEDNYVTSFRGFVTQPKLQCLWLDNNPIADHAFFRVMALIVCGSFSLTRINGVAIDKQERDLAVMLAPYVTDALRQGWLLGEVPNNDAVCDISISEFNYFSNKDSQQQQQQQQQQPSPAASPTPASPRASSPRPLPLSPRSLSPARRPAPTAPPPTAAAAAAVAVGGLGGGERGRSPQSASPIALNGGERSPVRAASPSSYQPTPVLTPKSEAFLARNSGIDAESPRGSGSLSLSLSAINTDNVAPFSPIRQSPRAFASPRHAMHGSLAQTSMKPSIDDTQENELQFLSESVKRLKDALVSKEEDLQASVRRVYESERLLNKRTSECSMFYDQMEAIVGSVGETYGVNLPLRTKPSPMSLSDTSARDAYKDLVLAKNLRNWQRQRIKTFFLTWKQYVCVNRRVSTSRVRRTTSIARQWRQLRLAKAWRQWRSVVAARSEAHTRERPDSDEDISLVGVPANTELRVLRNRVRMLRTQLSLEREQHMCRAQNLLAVHNDASVAVSNAIDRLLTLSSGSAGAAGAGGGGERQALVNVVKELEIRLVRARFAALD